MKPIRKVFVWGTDDEYGNEGWIPADMPEFNAGDARLVAHDTLEHSPKDDGSIADELRALGAVVYVRVNSGVLHNPESNLAADLMSLFRDMWYSGEPLPPARSPALPVRVLDCIIEGALEYNAPDDVLCEIGAESDEDRAVLKAWRTFKVRARALMRQGYRRAARRYADCPDIGHLWRAVQAAVPASGEWEGERMALVVHPMSMRVFVDRESNGDEIA